MAACSSSRQDVIGRFLIAFARAPHYSVFRPAAARATHFEQHAVRIFNRESNLEQHIMHSVALPVLLLIGLASCPVLAAVPAADPGEAGVRAVENGWSKAFVTGDAAYLDALLDPAYVSVGTRGEGRSKADIIAMAKAYGSAHPGAQATPLSPTATIDVRGTAAIVVHHGQGDTSVDIFHYTDKRWRAWYSQHTAKN
jgi:hypothetical protein